MSSSIAPGPVEGPRPGASGTFGSLGRGTGILLAGTGLLFLFGFLSRVLIARELPVAEWGIFSLALALSGLLSIVGLLGLDQAVARALSFERRAPHRWAILRFATGLGIGAAVVVIVGVFTLASPIAAAFHLHGMTWVIQLFAFATGFNLLSLVFAAIFQGFEDARPNALFNQIANPGLFLAFVVLAVVGHWGFAGVVGGYLAASAVSFVALAVYCERGLRAVRPSGPTPVAPIRELLALSGALWGVGTLAYTTAFADTIILGAFRSASEVGSYAAIMVLARVLLVANGTLTYIYLPIASRLASEGDRATIRSTYIVGTRWMLVLVTPAFLIFLLDPQLSLSMVFGPNYSGATWPFQILVVPAFLAVLVGPSPACLAGVGEFRSLLGCTVASAAVNLGLSFGLIPEFGILGAAVAWGVARVTYPLLAWVVLFERHGVNPFTSTLLRPLALAILLTAPLCLAVGALHPAPWIVIPLFGAGMVIAVASLALSRSLLPGDRAVAELVEQALRRPLPRLRRFLDFCEAPPRVAFTPDSPGP